MEQLKISSLWPDLSHTMAAPLLSGATYPWEVLKKISDFILELGATLPKALSVQTYLAYMNPDLLQRPLAMAMNGTMLLLSTAISGLYALAIIGLNRKIGGAK